MTPDAQPAGALRPGRASGGPPLRRVAIVGAGPMGASLAAILSSHLPTVLVVRNSARARRVRDHGISLRGGPDAHGRPAVVASVEDLAAIHPIDLVFIATKTTAIAGVCEAMRPHRRELPFVVSYQNGIEPGRAIIRSLGTPRVVRMVLNYGAALEEGAARGPLAVRMTIHAPPHFVGGEGEEALGFARALAERLSAMGLPTAFAPDIEREVWRKGLMNAASSPVSALVRAPLGELFRLPSRSLVVRLLDEGIAVAQAAGIDLGPGFRAEALDRMERGGAHLPSMAEDVIAGRESEITQLNAQVAERGRELGVATPTHDTVVELVRAIDALASRGG